MASVLQRAAAQAAPAASGAAGRTGGVVEDAGGSFETLVVNEAEAEAEEEAEQEAEQEEQKMSAFSRDDEQANPWAPAALLRFPSPDQAALFPGTPAVPTSEPGDHPFYPLSAFRVATGQAPLAFPPPLLVSDNYFRPRWVGLGQRRLKNVAFILEWCPGAGSAAVQRQMRRAHAALVAQGLDPTTAAIRALHLLSSDPAAAAALAEQASAGDPVDDASPLPRFLVAVSLAEGERCASPQGLVGLPGWRRVCIFSLLTSLPPCLLFCPSCLACAGAPAPTLSHTAAASVA